MNNKFKIKCQYPTIEELSRELLHFGNSSGAADQNDLRDVLLLHLSVLQDDLETLNGPAEEVHIELLKFGAGQHLVEVITL